MKIQRFQIFIVMIVSLIILPGCNFHFPDFSADISSTENQLKEGESLDQFAIRMRDNVNKLAKKNPDTLYNVTISFKKYIHYKEVEQFASRFGITTGEQVLYAVHSLKGPPPLSPAKPLAEQFQNLKNNLIADYSTETYKGRPLQQLAVQELKEDRLYIGYLTVNISPKLAKKIWNESPDVVRFMEVLTDPNIKAGGFRPEKDSTISAITDADEHIAKCEQAPNASIPWPTLPETCKH